MRLTTPRGCGLLAGTLALASAACGDGLELSSLTQGVTAHCQVSVAGQGTLDMESDYVPHVVACENGNADTEALKAQAVAARSFAYYKLATAGSLKDSQADQVYSCGREPGPEHVAAAKATSGQVLVYGGKVICAFYVAGGKGTPPGCKGGSASTENYVTYNEGKSGSSVEQSTLGWVSPSNTVNRGCMSQNGADCLSKAGRSYAEILRFYYGADIEIVSATGSCVTPQPLPDASSPTTPPEPDAGAPNPPTGQPDAGSPPLVTPDAGSWTPTVPPQPAEPDRGVVRPSLPGSDGGASETPALYGGCGLVPGDVGAAPGVALLMLLIAARASSAPRRRRRRACAKRASPARGRW